MLTHTDSLVVGSLVSHNESADGILTNNKLLTKTLDMKMLERALVFAIEVLEYYKLFANTTLVIIYYKG